MTTPLRKLGLFTLLLFTFLLRGSPAHAVGCEVLDCGSNTPVLFATPIIGLSTNGGIGSTRTERVILDPTLTRVRPLPGFLPDCPQGAKLIIQNGELKGTLNNQVVCRGASLIGMAFQITVPVGKNAKCHSRGCKERDPKKVQIRIDAIGAVFDWVVPVDSVVPTYRMVWESIEDMEMLEGESPLPVLGESICPRRVAWMDSWQMSSHNGEPTSDAGPAGQSWRTSTDHLMIVQGEIYDQDASVDKENNQYKQGAEWFSLACAGSAISKMRLLGYDPMIALTSGRAERQSTLKMLSGRYRGPKTFTAPGTPLMWRHRLPRTFVGSPEVHRWSPNLIEAYWGENGALCVTHRRTWRTSPDSSTPVNRSLLIPERPQPALPSAVWPCVSGSTSLACSRLLSNAEGQTLSALRSLSPAIPVCGAPPKSYFWVTHPVDHLPHPLPSVVSPGNLAR